MEIEKNTSTSSRFTEARAADASCTVLTAAIPILPVIRAPMIANILRIQRHRHESNYISTKTREHKSAQWLSEDI